MTLQKRRIGYFPSSDSFVRHRFSRLIGLPGSSDLALISRHQIFRFQILRKGVVTSAYTFAYTLATGYAYALMYVPFVHSALGNESAGVKLVYEGTCCLAPGVIFDRKRDRGVVCVFSIFDAGGSVCGCMCVYTHTHTHTAHMGYSVVNPGVGMRHLVGPKNLDGLNLGIHIFRYVYKAYNGGNRKGVQNRFVSKL